MLRMTEVVKNLLIINVIIFFAVKFLIPIPGIERYFILSRPNYAGFEPVQLITHMFMHANFEHLFFNMFGLYMFGPYAAKAVGFFCAEKGKLVLEFTSFEI